MALIPIKNNVRRAATYKMVELLPAEKAKELCLWLIQKDYIIQHKYIKAWITKIMT